MKSVLGFSTDYGTEHVSVSLSVRNLIDLLAQAAANNGSAQLETLAGGRMLRVRVEPDAQHYNGRTPGFGSGSHVALRSALAVLVGSGLAEEPASTAVRV